MCWFVGLQIRHLPSIAAKHLGYFLALFPGEPRFYGEVF